MSKEEIAISFLMGCVLGDANISKRSNSGSVQVVFSHSVAQMDLLKWKAQQVKALFDIEAEVHSYDVFYNGKKFIRTMLSFTSGGMIRDIYESFYPFRQKIVPDAVELMKHPIGLAMLLCDDGSVLKRKKIYPDGSIHYLKPALTIATHSFSRGDVEKLLSHIQKLCGASGYINLERRIRQGKRVEYNRTRFNIAEGKKLWDFVIDDIPRIPSMNKKFAFMYETYSPQGLA